MRQRRPDWPAVRRRVAERQPDRRAPGIGLTASWVLLAIVRLKHSLADDDQRLIAIFSRRGPNVIVMLLFVASGAALAADANAGLYLLLPASLVAFVSGVLNAWYFLLPPPPDGHEAPERDR
jgi:hypothetical protein